MFEGLHCYKDGRYKNGNDKLCLSYVRPHGSASIDAVSRWTKTVLLKAGIQEFEPHSFSAAVASAMIQSGKTLEAFFFFFKDSCMDKCLNIQEVVLQTCYR